MYNQRIHSQKNPLISAASWLQKSRDANAIKFVPTIWVRHAFQQVLMTEQDCHPGVSPPISTKGTMSHVFTCTSPGTDWGLKCAWSHSTSPSGAEDSYLPTIQVGWNNMRKTTSLLPSPWAASWVHFQTLPALITLGGGKYFNNLCYICTNIGPTGWSYYIPRPAEDRSCCPKAENQQEFGGDGLALKCIPDWTTWQSWSSLVFLPFP